MTRPMMPPVPQRPMMPVRRAEGGPAGLSSDEAMVLRYWRGKPIQHFEGGGLAGGSNNGNKIGAGHDDTKSGNGGGGGSGNGGGQFDHQGNPVGPSTPGKSKYSGYQGGNDGSAAPGGNPGGGGTSSAPQNSRAVDDAMAAKYGLSPQKYINAARGLSNRISDAKDTGESTLNKFFKGLGSLVGAYESDPTSGLNYGDTTNLDKAWSESLADADAGVMRDPTGSADWHEDPFQALATAAGVITGAPIGSVYGGLTSTFGHPTVGQINMGPDVFGGGAPDMSKLTDSQNKLANTDNYHGLEGSGSSDNGAAGSGGGAGKPGSGGSGGTLGGLSSATGGTGGTGGKPAAGDTATDTPVAPVGTVIKPYTGDPLHYGEVGGEWKFLQPVTAADGGKIAKPKGGRSQAMQSQPDIDPSLAGTLGSVFQRFPALAKYKDDYAMMRGRPMVAGDDRQLESYSPDESWNPIPGKATTELYNNGASEPEQQNLIAGDMLHHLAAVDPKWAAMKAAVVPKDMTPARGDEFLMGYLTPDKTDDWRGSYTSDQRSQLAKMADYLSGKTAPDEKARGGDIRGPGGGQEDKIPAMLSDGEFVMDAATTAALGDGSTDEGVRRLEKMRQMIRQKAGYKNTKSIPPKMHSIGSLLQKVA